MKQFILNGLLFLLFFCLIMIPLCVFNIANQQKLLAKEQCLPDGKSVLALGDSHVECSLNDRIFKELVNRGNSSENYFYNWGKLEYFTQVSKIQTIILSYNYFSLIPSLYNYNGLAGNTSHYMYASYFPILIQRPQFIKSMSEQFFSLRFVSSYFNEKYGFPNKKIFNRFFQRGIIEGNDFDFSGGFRDEDICQMNAAKVEVPLLRQFENKKDFEVYDFLLKSLYEIGDYTQKNNIKLVLYNAPCHNDYNAGIPVNIKSGVDSLASDFCAKYNATYLNFHDYPIPDSCFRDYDHLNNKGAAIITPIVRDTLIGLGILSENQMH